MTDAVALHELVTVQAVTQDIHTVDTPSSSQNV